MSTPQLFDRGRAPVPPEPTIEDTLPLGPPPVVAPPGDLGGEPEHRRRRWIWVVVAAAVLALVVPLLTYAIVRSGSDGEPAATPGPTAPAPTEPAPSPSAVPTAVPDGRISLTVLRDATLYLPGWPSDAVVAGPSGWVTFTDGMSRVRSDTDVPVSLAGGPAYGDVDRDGAQETVIAVLAGYEGGSWQVLALDRDAGGRIVTLGRVVATTGQIKMIGGDLTVTAGGTIRVEVADYMVCCGEDPTVPQWQTRAYAWQSRRFVQVAGPTRFPYNPRVTDVSVAARDVVLGPPAGGIRHGALRVTVTTLEPVPPHHLNLVIHMPANLIREGDGWVVERVEPQGNGIVWVYLTVPAPAVGYSRTYTLDVGRAVGSDGGDRLSVEVAGQTSENLGFGDLNGTNNAAVVRIRTTG
jgi:hypothetical protein